MATPGAERASVALQRQDAALDRWPARKGSGFARELQAPELCRATHVLVELTAFNANVAFELGIAHALGRPTRIVGLRGVEKRSFPMIAHRRVYPYNVTARLEELVRSVVDFLNTR